MKLIQFFFHHSRATIIASLIAGVVSGACNAAMLAVINSALKGRASLSTTVIWIFVVLCVVLPLSRFFSELLLQKLGQGALYKLRIELSRQILAAPLHRLEQFGSARLLTILTDDVPVITGTVQVIPLLCINAAVVIGCLVWMGLMSWVLLLVVLGFMLIGILSYQYPIIRAQSIFQKARKDSDDLMGHFRALTHGAKELKIHNERKESFLKDILAGSAASFRDHSVAGMNVYTAAASWGQSLVFVVVGLVVLALPFIWHLDGRILTGYALALLFLANPLQVIMNSLPGMGRANVALNNVKNLGFQLISENTGDLQVLTGNDRGTPQLTFVNVAHTYTNDVDANQFTLGPLNIAFNPGQLIFITGGNGSGKTTFAKLLTGLYAPDSGEILLNGDPICDENRERYRQLFSVVFSDFYLFDSLLGLATPGLDERALDYLNQLKLSHKVKIEQGRLSTIDLSQGQRKRLALLTAYLEERPIYVFDEWAADQDPYFKNIFYLELLPQLKARNKTVFVISHDDRYYDIADRLIKLDEGQVVEDSQSPNPTNHRFPLSSNMVAG